MLQGKTLTESRYGDDDESSLGDKIFTAFVSLAFAVLVTTDTSYPTGTPILVCTHAT